MDGMNAQFLNDRNMVGSNTTMAGVLPGKIQTIKINALKIEIHRRGRWEDSEEWFGDLLRGHHPAKEAIPPASHDPARWPSRRILYNWRRRISR
jgi:hypothetical protein